MKDFLHVVHSFRVTERLRTPCDRRGVQSIPGRGSVAGYCEAVDMSFVF